MIDSDTRRISSKLEQDDLEKHDTTGKSEWTPSDSLPDLSSCATQEEWTDALKAIGWPEEPMFPFKVNLWGSCQYATAKAIYDIWFMMRHHLSRDNTISALDVKITHKAQRNFGVAKQMFIDYAIEKYKYRDDGRCKVEARRVQSYDDMFFVKRKWSSDLWSAAPQICKLAFVDFEILTPGSPGRGPVCNVNAQSSNFEVGLCCAYMVECNVIRNESSFFGFDT
jgi:hypothetical protein